MTFVSKVLESLTCVALALLLYSFVDGLTGTDTDVAERLAPPPPAVTHEVEATSPLPTAKLQPLETPPPSLSAAAPTSVDAEEAPATAAPSEHESTPEMIAQSAPVQLYQPDTGMNIRVLELPDGFRSPVSPPSFSEAYWNPEPLVETEGDFRPGQVTDDLSVIAAHTGSDGSDLGFNPLYDWTTGQFTLSVGQEVWLRTEASRDDWLVYRLTNQLFVPKGELPDSTEVWGEAAKPNHLILIGCRQIGPGTPSQDNIVLDFVFDRVDRP